MSRTPDPICHAIVSSYLPSVRVVAVTTERSGRWWGRDVETGLGTGGCVRNIRARFETEAEAIARLTAFRQLQRDHEAAREPLHNAERRIRRAVDAASEQILGTGVYTPFPFPFVSFS